eukprot:COSAG06_NODE_21747_length_746_cov_36.234930_2_plen_56_part_00
MVKVENRVALFAKDEAPLEGNVEVRKTPSIWRFPYVCSEPVLALCEPVLALYIKR